MAVEIIVHNFERLSEEQKTLVPNDSFKLAKQYLEVKLDLAIPTRTWQRLS